jgi:hypothetical protein
MRNFTSLVGLSAVALVAAGDSVALGSSSLSKVFNRGKLHNKFRFQIN